MRSREPLVSRSGATTAMLSALLALAATALAPRTAHAVATCNASLNIDYTGPSFALPGNVYRVGVTLGAGSILGGTQMTINRVRFELDCNSSGLGVPCTDDGSLIEYEGDDTITTTCPGIALPTTNHGVGVSASPNELIITPNPPIQVPANTPAFCRIEFDVKVLSISDPDSSPTRIEQGLGYSVAASDAVCSNGLTSGGVGGLPAFIDLCPACVGAECNDSACNQNVGQCVITPKASDTPCSDTDGNPCTTAGCDGAGSCNQSQTLCTTTTSTTESTTTTTESTTTTTESTTTTTESTTTTTTESTTTTTESTTTTTSTTSTTTTTTATTTSTTTTSSTTTTTLLHPSTDVPLDGNRMRLNDSLHPQGRRSTVGLLDHDVSLAVVDPTMTGATASIGRVGDGSVTVLDLPANGWSRTGNPARTEFKFKSRTGPVTSARLVDGSSVRFSAHGPGAYGLGGMPQGAVGVIVQVGDVRFCGVFGGTIARDDGMTFRARRAPAPRECPTLGIGTTTTTTETTTTSTTTTTQCTAPTDCPGVDGPCQQRTCTGGDCGIDHVAAGTSIAQQLPGDCQERVCDGAGSVTTRPDNLDLPISASPCTTGRCLNGEATFVANAAGSACGPMMVCDGEGHCVGCASAADCPAGTDPDCQAAICVANTCDVVPTPIGTACADGGACDGSGTCVLPTTTTITTTSTSTTSTTMLTCFDVQCQIVFSDACNACGECGGFGCGNVCQQCTTFQYVGTTLTCCR